MEPHNNFQWFVSALPPQHFGELGGYFFLHFSDTAKHNDIVSYSHPQNDRNVIYHYSSRIFYFSIFLGVTRKLVLPGLVNVYITMEKHNF